MNNVVAAVVVVVAVAVAGVVAGVVAGASATGTEDVDCASYFPLVGRLLSSPDRHFFLLEAFSRKINGT